MMLKKRCYNVRDLIIIDREKQSMHLGIVYVIKYRTCC